MTAITLSAGRKHTIKVGDKVQEVTLRPGEVKYLPFVRAVMDIPKVETAKLPEKPTRLPYTPRKPVPTRLPYTPRKPVPTRLPYTPRVAPPTKVTYESWSRARPKPTFDDIIEMIEGIRGRREIGFKPTLDNLVSLLRKFRK